MNQNQRFFLKLFLFLILVLMINLGLNAIYDRWMYYFRLARNQDEQFQQLSDSLKYLMLGNSHNRISPEILGDGFCYITPKESYQQTYYKLKYILEQTDKCPENILLSIDPVNFSPKAENDRSFDGYWRRYLDYEEIAREQRDATYLLNKVRGTYFSYVGNYKYVYMSVLFFNTDLKKIKRGYFPARNYKNFAKEPKREALGYFVATTYLAGFGKSAQLGTTDYYRRILELCNRYNIHLVLLRMPLTDEYLKYARKMVDLETLDAEILTFTRQHTRDFELFDCRNEFHGKPEYFFNADHINPAGVEIVSKKLKEQLEGEKRCQEIVQ